MRELKAKKEALNKNIKQLAKIDVSKKKLHQNCKRLCPNERVLTTLLCPFLF